MYVIINYINPLDFHYMVHKKRKITVITGTRADYGILRPVLHFISQSKKLELYLIVVGMHLSKDHGMTINEIKKDDFKIFARIRTIPKSDSTYAISKALGQQIIAFSKVFQKIKPDVNLVLGDRDEMLASAIAASHMNIPNAHIHGGDISGGIDEYNRHAITKLSNIHFAATKRAKERIIKMGENPKYVFFTRSPSFDEIINNRITSKKELEKKYNLKFTGQEILLVQHPVTTEPEKSKQQIVTTLQAIIKLKRTTIAIAPNSDAGSRNIFVTLRLYCKKYNFIKMFLSVPRNDYLGLLKNCSVLVGNSSSGLIEASYFDIPVINIGIRQKNRERGRNVVDVNDESSSSIYNAILNSLNRKHRKKITYDYTRGSDMTSKKIVQYLEKIELGNKLIQKQLFY